MHKSRSQNIVADALSRRHTLLLQLGQEVVGFSCFRDCYEEDADLVTTWANYQHGHSNQDLYICDGY